MALYLVLLSTILAFSLASTEQYVSSPGSNISLSLDSMKNASGHSIAKVDTGRYRRKENPQPLSVNIHQGMSNKIEKLFSVDTVHPSLHDTSMSGAVQPTAVSTSTTNTSSTTTTTTTPKSCPQSGYQQVAEFNCYRAFPSFDDMKNWSEAREQCIRDGGDLMVMESDREREVVFIPLTSAGFYSPPWLGVYIPQGGDSWMSVKGQPALSTWWESGYPVNDTARKCALAFSTGLLQNYNCAYTQNFICEISSASRGEITLTSHVSF